MPKLLPARLREQVTTHLATLSNGASIAELEAVFAGTASRRSLQRRLDEWVKSGAIRAEGVRRSRRYFSGAAPTHDAGITHAATHLTPSQETLNVQRLPISTAGEEIQALVRRPIADRPPVGYQPQFLDSYEPNQTAYLSNALRSHLHELGRTPEERRPAGTYARDILNRLLIELSWSSSRLEGNTYSWLDTRELIERGIAAPGKDAKETQMILNHKAAIELLVESAQEIGINRYTLTNLHALLADNLLADSRNAGRLRTTPIGISASTYIPTAIPQLIEDSFVQLLATGAAIVDPFEQSLFLMVHLPYLQTFVDVNKRASRLAANIPFIKNNLVPLSFIDVPEKTYIEGLIGIYELNRIELLRDVYLWAYERSARRYKTIRDSLPEPDGFRLKYRTPLADVVGAAVRQRLPINKNVITDLARAMIPPEDLGQFTQLVVAELNDLHEGNIARFRLRPSEFRQWRQAMRPRETA